MRKRLAGHRAMLVFVFVVAATGRVFAQPVVGGAAPPAPPAVQRDEIPRGVLFTNGPMGVVKGLVFSNDSNRLYAGGHDKLVHVWNLLPGENGQDRATYVAGMRWEIARGYRGQIQTLAMHPRREELAAGGISARQSNGDLVLFDTAVGRVAKGLPVERPNTSNPAEWPGHSGTVTSLSYSPNGARLLSVDKLGQVRLWDTTKWSSFVMRDKYAVPGRLEESTYLPAIFLTDSLVVVSSLNGTDTQLQILDLDASREVANYRVPGGGLATAIVREPGTARWASAHEDGHIRLWNGVPPDQRPALITRAPHPPADPARDGVPLALSLAFGPHGSLAVGNARSAPSRTQSVELWDTQRLQLLDRLVRSPGEHVFAVAFSPNGQWLAISEPHLEEIWLYRMLGPGGQLVTQPFAAPAGPRLRLSSAVESFLDVAFAPPAAPGGSPRLLVARKTAPPGAVKPPIPGGVAPAPPAPGPAGYTHQLDLGRAEVRRLAAPVPFVPKNEGGFSLRAGPVSLQGKQPLVITGPSGSGTIELDRVRQGVYERHLFLFAGQPRPFAVAVATEEQYGIFLYDLPQGNQPARLLGYLRDHVGTITGLSESPDGRLMASSSRDGTVKLWAMAALRSIPKRFAPARAWGCEFGQVGADLVVTDVRPDGIAAARGLKNGDILKRVERGPVNKSAPDLAGMFQFLQQAPIFDTVGVTYLRPGEMNVRQVTITPASEPVVSLVIDRRQEWAVWTPTGYFVSSVIDGDELFGWQLNQGPGLPPRVLKGAELRKDLEKPDLIRELLIGANSLSDLAPKYGVAQAQVDNLFRLVAMLDQRLPVIDFQKPLLSQTASVNGATLVQASITLPPGKSADEFSLQAYMDGVSLADRKVIARQAVVGGTPVTVLDVSWPGKSLQSLSYCRVSAHSKDGLLKTESAVVAGDGKVFDKPYRLFLLGLASANYVRGGPPQLEFPAKDLEQFVQLLKSEQRGAARPNSPYVLGQEPIVLIDNAVTRASVSQAVAQLRATLANADPHDLLVVYMSGHGETVRTEGRGSEFHYLPTAVTKSEASDFAKNGIPWSVFESLGDVPCRKLILIDACKSGSLYTSAEQRRQNEPDGLGTVRRSVVGLRPAEWLILTSTSSESELAFEGKNYGGGHGAFTSYLLDGLRGHADGFTVANESHPYSRDGDVLVVELAKYVEEKTNEATGQLQTPRFSSPRFADLFYLPLVRVAQSSNP